MWGTHIYQKLVKGYTEKQWGRDCKELPAFIIKRLPVRYTYDNNYFNDLYQGIPIGGYNKITEKLFEGCEIRLGADYLADKEKYDALADKVGIQEPLTAILTTASGKLQYRSLRFETEVLDCDNYQGNAVINYTDRETPYTRRSLSTSTSSSEPRRRQSSRESTRRSGPRAWSRITRSTTREIRNYIRSMQNSPKKRRM